MKVSAFSGHRHDHDHGAACSVKGASGNTPSDEALAIAGVNFLPEQIRRREVKDTLFLANHPARKGRPWWITADSDSHNVYADTAVRDPNSSFDANGRRYEDPVHGGGLNLTDGGLRPPASTPVPMSAWPPSRTRRSCTLGDSLHVRRGSKVDLVIRTGLPPGHLPHRRGRQRRGGRPRWSRDGRPRRRRPWKDPWFYSNPMRVLPA